MAGKVTFGLMCRTDTVAVSKILEKGISNCILVCTGF